MYCTCYAPLELKLAENAVLKKTLAKAIKLCIYGKFEGIISLAAKYSKI